MSADPKLRLVVRYPDGRDASYPLQFGRFDIGSARAWPSAIQPPPAAAEQAHTAFHEGLVALGMTAACGLLLYGLMWHMSDLPLSWQNWCNNVLFTLAVFASLALVNRFRVPFAGRLLLPAAFVFSSIVN